MAMHKGFWRGRAVNFLLIVVVLVFCAVGLEFACRVLPISDSMGWNRTLPLSKRAERFESSSPVKIVAVGDSFAEWRAGEGVNMFDLLQNDLSEQGCKILNLGHAGTDVIDYVNGYRHYVAFKPDAIIMSLYLGNDVLNYTETSRVKGVDQWSLEDQQSGLKQIIKRHSTVINFLFRLGKQHFAFMQAGSFDKGVKELQKEAGLSDAQVQGRMAKLDPKIIELARSDSVNGWIPALGIVNPEYFKDLFTESSQQCRTAAESTIKLIGEFYHAQKVNNFLVVLMPVSIQISEKYDDFHKRCGYDIDNFSIQERRGLIRYLQRRLGELGIMTLDPTAELEKAYPAYIPLDEHLNAQGHKAVAHAMANFIRKQFAWKSSAN